MKTKPINAGEIRLMFEQWWLLEGQFACASGQPSHKETVFSAWLAGWDGLNRYTEARTALARATGEAET